MLGYQKRKFLFAALAVFLICAVWYWWNKFTPESEFKDFFADLSIAAPEHQTLHNFSKPIDVVKGDYFTADFQQSGKQFHDFLARLQLSEQEVSSKDGVWIKADSKIDPKYPWMLNIQAHVSDPANKSYEVHMEGRQPYNDLEPAPLKH
ncbi:MAG TPA: hypothetical protein VKV04_20370 [Verrucomicrobiae bacterium]|nr:hypothetical protein [Verrucomicrobiae bacterium]